MMLESIKNKKRLIIGMVGLNAMPGSFNYKGEGLQKIREKAVADAKKLDQAGIDGIMIQNVSDLPMKGKVDNEKIAYMSSIGTSIKNVVSDDCIVGVSVLKNDGEAAVAVADAIGADFIRLKVYVGAMVSSAGIEEGCMNRVLDKMQKLDLNLDIWADIHDRTGVPLGEVRLVEAVKHAFDKGMADAVIITGKNFEESKEWLSKVQSQFPSRYVFIGGGTKPDNVNTALKYADGVIVGSCLKEDGIITNNVKISRAEKFMNTIK